MSSHPPVLAVTTGEPAGIGPDLCLQIAQRTLDYRLVVLADRELLKSRAETLHLAVQIVDVTDNPGLLHSPTQHLPNCLYVYHIPLAQQCTPGTLNTGNAAYVLTMLQHAVTGCLENRFDALVTAPVHKGVINDAGIAFTGHTEYLAELTQSQVVMMLAGGGMRVALATTHLPLKDVSSAISTDSLMQQLRIIQNDLVNRFGIPQPRIAVAGLNPHAGEGGHLGREEIDVIIPALNRLREAGMQLDGPLPADTLFNPSRLAQYDCIFTMYHDQGLPVLKHASFGAGVNITLGLPIIRTSVDHGTALELAGTGRADPGSLLTAIGMAIELANNNKRPNHH